MSHCQHSIRTFNCVNIVFVERLRRFLLVFREEIDYHSGIHFIDSLPLTFIMAFKRIVTAASAARLAPAMGPLTASRGLLAPKAMFLPSPALWLAGNAGGTAGLSRGASSATGGISGGGGMVGGLGRSQSSGMASGTAHGGATGTGWTAGATGGDMTRGADNTGTRESQRISETDAESASTPWAARKEQDAGRGVPHEQRGLGMKGEVQGEQVDASTKASPPRTGQQEPTSRNVRSGSEHQSGRGAMGSGTGGTSGMSSPAGVRGKGSQRSGDKPPMEGAVITNRGRR
eukprot:TRINITY_DN44224_c0_g1_i1.p1 TRINITY_DN44224_c0_g1~~TRINITY_DN44224_c0_g1_i1.p1  ORF type:complete len:288 (+),score=37.24 TRINITY_DN44224_c0_g1_i1:29-892(+)